MYTWNDKTDRSQRRRTNGRVKMYNADDYKKITLGGLTIGLIFLISCIYVSGIGVEKGYDYARWLDKNNETLYEDVDMMEYRAYRFATAPRFQYNNHYYSGVKKGTELIRSERTSVISDRSYYDDINRGRTVMKRDGTYESDI